MPATNETIKEFREERIKIINSDVYCSKCGEFLGMICDPFRQSYCKKCSPDDTLNNYSINIICK
jgi:hypothetical protein